MAFKTQIPQELPLTWNPIGTVLPLFSNMRRGPFGGLSACSSQTLMTWPASSTASADAAMPARLPSGVDAGLPAHMS